MARVRRKKNLPYVGDAGTVLLLDTLTDITDNTEVKVLYKKPDGTEAEWIGTVFENTKVRYVIQVGDFDQAGIWVFQAFYKSGVTELRGEAVEQEVFAKFKN